VGQHDAMTPDPDKALSPFRAVLLDLDDTLIVEERFAKAQIRATSEIGGTDPEEWEALVVETARSAWHALPDHPACKAVGVSSWEGLWATFEGAHPTIAQMKESVASYREQVWTTAADKAGLDRGLAAEMSRMYVAGQRSGHPLGAGAPDLVRRATEIGPIGIVTNGPPDIQRLKIEQTGLSNAFSSIVISGELGVGKPDPEVFAHALRELGVDPRHAVMVGDNWRRDVEGALSAGLSAVWISHGHPAPRTDRRIRVARNAGEVNFDWDPSQL